MDRIYRINRIVLLILSNLFGPGLAGLGKRQEGRLRWHGVVMEL